MLAVNIGNSIISFGVFEENGELISSFDISSDNKKTSDEYVTIIRSIIRDKDVPSEKIDAAIVASVVPQLTDKIKLVVRELTKKEPITVGPGVKTGFHIKIDNPSELGADIVANTASAIQIKQRDHAAFCYSSERRLSRMRYFSGRKALL